MALAVSGIGSIRVHGQHCKATDLQAENGFVGKSSLPGLVRFGLSCDPLAVLLKCRSRQEARSNSSIRQLNSRSFLRVPRVVLLKKSVSNDFSLLHPLQYTSPTALVKA